MNTTELRHSDAAICRGKGWDVGDILHGEPNREDDASPTIRITAIGHARILARRVEFCSGSWVEVEREMLWTLKARNWERVTR